METSGSDTELVPGLAFQRLGSLHFGSRKARHHDVKFWLNNWMKRKEESHMDEEHWAARHGKEDFLDFPGQPASSWMKPCSWRWHYIEQNCLAKPCHNCSLKESWKGVKLLLFEWLSFGLACYTPIDNWNTIIRQTNKQKEDSVIVRELTSVWSPSWWTPSPILTNSWCLFIEYLVVEPNDSVIVEN